MNHIDLDVGGIVYRFPIKNGYVFYGYNYHNGEAFSKIKVTTNIMRPKPIRLEDLSKKHYFIEA